MKKLILVLCMFGILGCTHVVPSMYKFPEPPAVEAMQPCNNLSKLDPKPTLAQVASTIVRNYEEYNSCAIKLDTWILWYSKQRKLYEELYDSTK